MWFPAIMYRPLQTYESIVPQVDGVRIPSKSPKTGHVNAKPQHIMVDHNVPKVQIWSVTLPFWGTGTVSPGSKVHLWGLPLLQNAAILDIPNFPGKLFAAGPVRSQRDPMQSDWCRKRLPLPDFWPPQLRIINKQHWVWRYWGFSTTRKVFDHRHSYTRDVFDTAVSAVPSCRFFVIHSQLDRLLDNTVLLGGSSHLVSGL